MSTTSVAVKLDDTIRERLQKLGESKDRSPHWIMKNAILEYLVKEERYEKELREDQTRWENYALTGEAIPHSDMEKWLKELL